MLSNQPTRRSKGLHVSVTEGCILGMLLHKAASKEHLILPATVPQYPLDLKQAALSFWPRQQLYELSMMLYQTLTHPDLYSKDITFINDNEGSWLHKVSDTITIPICPTSFSANHIKMANNETSLSLIWQ